MRLPMITTPFLRRAAFAAALCLGLHGGAAAATLEVGTSNIASRGMLGDAANTVLTFQLGAGAHVTGLRWDLQLEALAPSWLSELRLAVSGSDVSGGGLLFAPGDGRDAPGSFHAAGMLDLAASGLDFRVGADGVLRLEFHEAASDGLNPDGFWRAGTLIFDSIAAPVPEPASALLLAAGGALVIGVARRRRVNDTPASHE